ncbi:Gfo/Idh/MocA family oxidoreductase [Novosphingobium sp. FSY-8]|uniref:Gfo/Idh/MocA family oxidoreductase n=1 Tax=Novosphingobium ovatum TaxID=1908523 RepID=A0ABW9XBF8_9SPHN|nr:Gfo/Idh/MocA family oxidoreductase [Novosphingobium ovatum]NBC35875.1 Gfo/Idh/MocA family oxidoreductase [Novosphingobium ovatum]
MTAPIPTTLIGYGMAGRVFHAPLIRACAGLALTTIVSSRVDEIAALDPAIRAQPDVDAALADPATQLVVIATPTASHADVAARALRAGKHVVVDKPMALTHAQAVELVDLAKACGRHLITFHNRRWDTCFLAVRDAIASGQIGRVTHFESHFDRFRPTVRDRWREDGAPGSGVWYDLGPHLVDQALVLFGRPDAVSADIAALRHGGRADDFAHVVLRYPDMRVVLQASLNAPNGPMGGHPRFAVYGTMGAVVKSALDPQEDMLVAGLRPGDAGWAVDGDPLIWHDGEGATAQIPAPMGSQERFYALVAGALNGGPLPCSPAEMLAVCQVIEAAFTSAREGRVVALDD